MAKRTLLLILVLAGCSSGEGSGGGAPWSGGSQGAGMAGTPDVAMPTDPQGTAPATGGLGHSAGGSGGATPSGIAAPGGGLGAGAAGVPLDGTGGAGGAQGGVVQAGSGVGAALQGGSGQGDASGGRAAQGGSEQPTAGHAGAAQAGAGGVPPSDTTCTVEPLTEELRLSYDNLDPFYQKWASAHGLPIISSAEPADEALTRVCWLVVDLVSARPDVLDALLGNFIRFAVIGKDELTNDIPEYSYMDDSINQRARGLGGVPAASCAEESILCDTARDPWRGEGICVHEFAHTIATGGLFPADPTFEGRLRTAYQSAQSAGLFANTYAMENFQEYWAEGVQDWYYTNLEADPPNGIHNHVDRREELQQYDPTLYNLLAEFLPNEPAFVDCYSDE